MTIQILSDPDRDMSVMVDDELGRAFGYVTSGEGHRELLQVFMDALPVHPGAFLPHELDKLWDSFTETAREQLSARDAADGPPPDAARVDSVTVEGAQPPGQGPAAPQEPAQEPTAPAPANAPEEPAQTEPSEVDCFNCDGKGIMAHDSSRCPVCNGTGKLLVSPSNAAPGS